MFEGEDHRLCEEHPAGLFVDGCGDYVGIDGQTLAIALGPGVHVHLHCGVLGGQKGSQVFVENEHHLDLSCTAGEKKQRGGEKDRC